jgi:hypothetical protein
MWRENIVTSSWSLEESEGLERSERLEKSEGSEKSDYINGATRATRVNGDISRMGIPTSDLLPKIPPLTPLLRFIDPMPRESLR